jgi:hypothetical protein
VRWCYTNSRDRKLSDRKWCQSHDQKWRQSRGLSGRMLCACATVSCAISALGGFWPEVTKTHDRKRPYPEAALWSEVCSAHARFYPRFILSSSTVVVWIPKMTKGHLTPSGFPWVCACGTGCYATSAVTEGTWPLRKCPLGRLRPIFSMVTGNNPGYLPLLFSYNASLYVIRNNPDRWRHYLVTW